MPRRVRAWVLAVVATPGCLAGCFDQLNETLGWGVPAQRLSGPGVEFGRRGVEVGPQPPPGTLKIADLPSDSEPDHPGRAATPEEFTEVLGTALFDAVMAIASLNGTRGPESWGGGSEL